VDVSELGTDFQLVVAGDPALLEIFVTGTGDAFEGSSAVDTWIPLINTEWGYEVGVSQKTFTGTYSVRVASTGQVLGGSTFDVTIAPV
jgi:hypothetical protein